MAMTGGCLCGAVRYELSGEPTFVGSCYCTQCQKESGAGHNTAVAMPNSATKITGETKVYSQPGASGKAVKRNFCANCGTTVFGQPELMPDTTIFRAGTLDDSSGLAISMAVYGAEAQSWDQPPEGIPIFAGMPNRE